MDKNAPQQRPSFSKASEEDEQKLSLVCWNIDGLDTETRLERAQGLWSYLDLYAPDVVLLQELIPSYVLYLKKQAVSYHIIEGGEVGYFTGMMLKKSRIELLEKNIVPFPTSKMLRNLLVAQVTFKDHKLCLMTSHFESRKANSEERMKQLRVVMQKMTDAPDDTTVVFGGDTNLRNTEMAEVGLPSNVCDVWERLGKREHVRYTWDTESNTNNEIPHICRFRFDRIYLRPPLKEGVSQILPESMALIGREKLECGRFTSDHWGIYCCFVSS